MTACPKCGREPKAIATSYPDYNFCYIRCPFCSEDEHGLTTHAHLNMEGSTRDWEQLVKEWVEAHPKPADVRQTAYVVLTAVGVDELRLRVEAYLREGWKLQGGVAAWGEDYIMQAMTKEEEEA